MKEETVSYIIEYNGENVTVVTQITSWITRKTECYTRCFIQQTDGRIVIINMDGPHPRICSEKTGKIKDVVNKFYNREIIR